MLWELECSINCQLCMIPYYIDHSHSETLLAAQRAKFSISLQWGYALISKFMILGSLGKTIWQAIFFFGGGGEDGPGLRWDFLEGGGCET